MSNVNNQQSRQLEPLPIEQKRGAGRPSLPEEERARTIGFSVRPVTLERLREMGLASNVPMSAILEQTVHEAYQRYLETTKCLWSGFAPVHGMAIGKALDDVPIYSIWTPTQKTIGYGYRCNCEIRGDGSWYVWLPCFTHAELAHSMTSRRERVDPKYQGGEHRSFPPPAD